MSNFLDLKCPNCGDEDQLRVAATVWIDLFPDGSDATDSDHEFEPTSLAHCHACGHFGTVADFEEV